MSKAAETLFNEGVERYQASEAAETLIPVFKEICDRSPKNSAAWTSLAWLYLLESKANSAMHCRTQSGETQSRRSPGADQFGRCDARN